MMSSTREQVGDEFSTAAVLFQIYDDAVSLFQCYVSESAIRCLCGIHDRLIRDLVGSGIRGPRSRMDKNQDPGSGRSGTGIRDKHLGSATLLYSKEKNLNPDFLK